MSTAQPLVVGQTTEQDHTSESLVDLVARRGEEYGHRLSGTILECAADLALAGGKSYLAAALDRAADSARRGFVCAAVYDAQAALVQAGVEVVGWVKAEEIPAPKTAEEQVLDATVDLDEVVKVRVKYVDGPATARVQHDERLTMTVREALAVVARPGVGVRGLRLKAAVEAATPALAMLSKLAEQYRPEATELACKLARWARLSPGQCDGGWGGAAKKMAGTLAAAVAEDSTATPLELGRLVVTARKLANTTRSGMAKRVAVELRTMLADGPIADPDPVATAKRRVARWYAAQAKANRGPLVLGYGAMIMCTPDPVKLAVLGPFDYPVERAVVAAVELEHDAHVRCWARTLARTRFPSINNDWLPRWAEYARLMWGERARLVSALTAPTELVPEEQDHDAHVRCYRMAVWAARPKTAPAPEHADCNVSLSECNGWVGRVECAVDSGPLVRASCGCCHMLLPLAAEQTLARVYRHGGTYQCPSCGARNGVE